MYKLIAIGLITLDTVLLLSSPLSAQDIIDKNDCTATILSAQNEIQNGRSLVVLIRSLDISSQYTDYPDSRPYSYAFVLNGTASESILKSPKFMKKIATRIINSCKSVSLVQFAEANTDSFNSFGLMPKGTIELFECLEPGKGVRMHWGQEICP